MGTTGHVGGEIARQLSAAGIHFRIGVRQPERAPQLPGAEVCRFDAGDPATYGALDGVQRMFVLWPPGTDVNRDVLPMLERAPIGLRRFAEDHRAVWMKGESETG